MALFDKAELHCHLSGLVSPWYLDELREAGRNIPIDTGMMRRYYPIVDLSGWNAMSDYALSWMVDQGELLLDILRLHLQALRAQQVTYVEIMLDSFLGHERIDELLSQYRVVAASWPDIEVGYLGTVSRTPDRQKFERKVERISALWRSGLLDGLAVATDERLCRMEDYADIFHALSAEHVPVEIHAGETMGPDSIWDALEFGHARRLGHALSLFDDPVLVDHVLSEDIHIEYCPTSNIKVGMVDRIENHPVFKAEEIGLNYSINTDDPGHFECSMSSEFELLASIGQFDVARIYRNTRRSAFRASASIA